MTSKSILLAENVFRSAQCFCFPKLHVTNTSISICDETIPITSSSSIVLIGFGKAVIGMASGALLRLKTTNLPTRTILIAPKQYDTQPTVLPSDATIFYAATNNIPDRQSVEATEFVIREIRRLDSQHTIFVFLISGGGSALLCAPQHGLTYFDKQHTQQVLFSNGATIHQVNQIRQRLSRVKRGKLLNYIQRGTAISMIISDVVGDPIEIIASGPTVRQPPNLPISEQLNIDKALLKPAVLMELEKTEEIDEISNVIAKNFIVSSNKVALETIRDLLEKEGYSSTIVTSILQGDSKYIGEKLAELLLSDLQDFPAKLAEFGGSESAQLPPLKYPFALLFGGETSSQVKSGGKGGRTQEIALACLDKLSNTTKIKHGFQLLCAGTDGQDGPTDAAGVIICNSDVTPSPSIKKYLDSSDSYNFWKNYLSGRCHIKTGPTGTNVMDIIILLVF